jgi:hypothetical protein
VEIQAPAVTCSQTYICFNATSLPTGSSGASPVTLAITTTIGNGIIVKIQTNSPVTAISCTDSASNTYTVLTGGTATAGNTWMCYTPSLISPGVTSVKITLTSSTGVTVSVDDVHTPTAMLVSAQSATSSTTSANPAPSLTAAAGDYVASVIADNNSVSAVASPFTLDAMSTSGITNWAAAAHYQNAAGGTTTSTYTATSALWSGFIVAFKVTSSAAHMPPAVF